MALQTPVPDDILLKRVKAGLPSRLHDQAIFLTGYSETVLIIVSRLSSAKQVVFRARVQKGQEKSPDSSAPRSTKDE